MYRLLFNSWVNYKIFHLSSGLLFSFLFFFLFYYFLVLYLLTRIFVHTPFSLDLDIIVPHILNLFYKFSYLRIRQRPIYYYVLFFAGVSKSYLFSRQQIRTCMTIRKWTRTKKKKKHTHTDAWSSLCLIRIKCTAQLK